MYKTLRLAGLSFVFIFLTSCEEVVSSFFDNDTLKKLRTENTTLRIQLDKLQRQSKDYEQTIMVKDLIISMYDLRHAVERYASNNRGEYPNADNIKDLSDKIKPFLPKDYTIDSTYLETIKSSVKGYIFIANIKDQKIVVSNLI